MTGTAERSTHWTGVISQMDARIAELEAALKRAVAVVEAARDVTTMPPDDDAIDGAYMVRADLWKVLGQALDALDRRDV